MKLKKYLVALFSFILVMSTLIGATPIKSERGKGIVVMGEIKEINKNDKGEVASITVDGYIKGREVLKKTIIGLISKDTKVLNSQYDKKEDIVMEKGDIVSMRVDEAMTKSLPPQTNIKRIFITKSK